MRDKIVSILTVLSKPTVSIGGAVVIGIIAIGFALYATSVSPSGNYTPVKVGTITEEVDISGIVKASHSTDLAFQTSGRVAVINVSVGDHVWAGETLIALDGSSQSAAVALAKANLEAQQARLNALLAGTRPEQVAINKSILANAITSAYAVSDSAVHTSADQFFANPRNSNAALTFNISDSALTNTIVQERIALEPILAAWNAQISSGSFNSSDLISASAQATQNISQISTFLNDAASSLTKAQISGSLSPTVAAMYEASIATARANVSGALSALTSAKGALTLAEAGATQNDIDAQKASVDAAQASVDAAQAIASQTVISAPTSGTITAQNANLGQTAVPGAPLVSIIADGKYQADAKVSQTDIAKIKMNNAVEATFAEYPGVNFDATVTTVNPAATVNGGASFYGITVTFANNDPRLKQGLSANLHIITATKDSVLVIPSSAIITSGNQKFVYVKNANGTNKVAVETGIGNTDGMTEITKGLHEGDKVLTFGTNAAQ